MQSKVKLVVSDGAIRAIYACYTCRFELRWNHLQFHRRLLITSIILNSSVFIKDSHIKLACFHRRQRIQYATDLKLKVAS